MTLSDNSAGSERVSVWSDLRRRHFQKRYLLSWILGAILPFILLRLLFMSEIAFPFQSVSVSAPEISLEVEENVTQGHSIAFASYPVQGPALGSDDVKSKTTIPESPPLIRPDEDAWITHDEWINHDLNSSTIENRKENDDIIPTGYENSTEFKKEFLPETTNGGDFGLPEDNEKEVVDSQNNQNKTEKEHEEAVAQEKEAEVKSKVDGRSSDLSPKSNSEEVPDGGADEQAKDVQKDAEEPSAGECDLFEGQWEHDPEGPQYTNSTCFYIQEAQNCMSNGRLDTDYLYWRWKPWGCDLPRFDAKSFLEKFRGKAIGFVGDSIARNQMQSLLCLLSRVEIPIMTYESADDKTVWWLYKEHQVTLAVLWSPYLLKQSEEGDMGFEKGQSVLYLDVLDTAWTSVMQNFDIMVFLTGQWYYKRSVYVKQEEVIGCHYCPGLNLTDIGFYEAYREGIRQVLEKVSGEYKGVAIMSTFPLSHFENGTWDTGGYCRRKLPLQPLESTQFPGLHNAMHDIVIEEFKGVVRENRELNRHAQLEILDVTKVSLQRADGHPGPFRRPHPEKGRDPNLYYPNDCLHWCLPGPIEAWNQLVVKIVDKYL